MESKKSENLTALQKLRLKKKNQESDILLHHINSSIEDKVSREIRTLRFMEQKKAGAKY